MNLDAYALSKRLDMPLDDLLKKPIAEYYELFLTDKKYQAEQRRAMEKANQ